MLSGRGFSGGRSAGFTLLELIVSITLMGLILVVLYGGLRVGLDSWDGGERRAEQTQRLRSVQEFLRRQLQQSVTVYQNVDNEDGKLDQYLPSGRTNVVVFMGQPDMTEVVVPMMAHLGQGGLYRLRIHVDQENRLRVRWRPYLPEEPEAGVEQSSVLLEGVSSIEWSYFGVEADDESNGDIQKPQWHSKWRNFRQRPRLVRLILNLEGEAWPDLVVALAEGPWR
ncbi:MAG: hypothetical protein CSA09_05140 [Candidatus Contendobacter odensis]|uniref:Type II secretion system protein J n=1 Tax=Candidatus Contendibacter odensensis TaxID=1400860 RepID=A0A2G6PE05_9GAMM|nr:MAG: hypothetical protein CSA09_05140 [Candidatus Contendobacter odensis]